MSYLKNRHWREIGALLEGTAPQTVTDLARTLGIKGRTLRGDLPVLTSYLRQRGAALVREGNRGLLVLRADPAVQTRLRKELSTALESDRALNPQERRRRMLIRCLLGSDIPTLDEWSEEFGVSRPSIVKDMKAVKEWLGDRRLGLVGKAGVGYSLVGQEFDLRNALVQVLLQGEEGKLTPLGDFDFGPARDFLDQAQTATHARLIESDYLALLFYIAVSVVRLRQGQTLPAHAGQLASLVDSDEYRAVAQAVPLLEEAYAVTFSPSETAHLSLNFICAKKLATQSACTPAEGTAPGEEAERLAREVIGEAEDTFGVPLSKDADFVRLLATHIGITLRKVRFGLPLEVEAPVEYLKRQHPLAYGVGLSFCERLSRRGVKVPPVEAAFIAMHIAAGLEKVKYRLHRRKRVALVCTTALSASTLLFWQLTNLLPEVDVVQVGSYDDVVQGRITAEVDLIVSTVPLPLQAAPAVVISPLFTGEDRRRIQEALQAGPDQDLVLRTVVQLLDPAAILLQRSFPDAQTLLSEVGRYLTRKRFARKGFAEALLEREARFGSALPTPVPMAMPHAGPTFTRQPTVALVTLTEPVRFKLVENPAEEMGVRLVVLPVLALDELTGMRFHELLSALRKRKLARAVLNGQDPMEVIQLIGANLKPQGKGGKRAR
ncbi:MAG TPA: PRD domain-containing protein [Firmicutes bacterium]|nr:PRD domain-containing protein [Bacillota bacterium]